jgi:hypothetical protein
MNIDDLCRAYANGHDFDGWHEETKEITRASIGRVLEAMKKPDSTMISAAIRFKPTPYDGRAEAYPSGRTSPVWSTSDRLDLWRSIVGAITGETA